jgi:hypothetical protein
LERQAKRGLTIRAFCRSEKLQESAFYFWRRTIAERDSRPTAREAPAFVPLLLSDRRMVEHAQEISIELRGGRKLRMNDSIAADRLAEIVRALEAAEARS